MTGDLPQIVPPRRDDFIQLSAHLLCAMETLAMLKEIMPDAADHTLIEQIDAALSEAFTRAREHQDFNQSLADLNARLMRQYQSAKDAFMAGWDARLADLMVKLSNEDFAALRHALKIIDNHDSMPY